MLRTPRRGRNGALRKNITKYDISENVMFLRSELFSLSKLKIRFWAIFGQIQSLGFLLIRLHFWRFPAADRPITTRCLWFLVTFCRVQPVWLTNALDHLVIKIAMS